MTPQVSQKKTGWKILAQSSVAVSGAADTNENALATITVPGGAMGANGRVRITTSWTFTNSANNKTPRVRFGGIGGTAYLGPTITANVMMRDQREISNRNAANSQLGSSALATVGNWGVSTSAWGTSAVDTSADSTIVISGQKATAGETITLESYLVELFYQP